MKHFLLSCLQLYFTLDGYDQVVDIAINSLFFFFLLRIANLKLAYVPLNNVLSFISYHTQICVSLLTAPIGRMMLKLLYFQITMIIVLVTT